MRWYWHPNEPTTQVGFNQGHLAWAPLSHRSQSFTSLTLAQAICHKSSFQSRPGTSFFMIIIITVMKGKEPPTLVMLPDCFIFLWRRFLLQYVITTRTLWTKNLCLTKITYHVWIVNLGVHRGIPAAGTCSLKLIVWSKAHSRLLDHGCLCPILDGAHIVS